MHYYYHQWHVVDYCHDRNGTTVILTNWVHLSVVLIHRTIFYLHTNDDVKFLHDLYSHRLDQPSEVIYVPMKKELMNKYIIM